MLALAAVRPAGAVDLAQRSLTLSDNSASASAVYDFKLTLNDASSTLGSIEFQFCSNSALIGDPCDAPAGFDASSSTLTNQSGASGFAINPASTTNNLIISRTPASPAGSDLEYVFSGVINPSSGGSEYVRVQTYSSGDASGPSTNQGALAFAIISPVQIQAQVPPYVTFCTGVTISGYDCSQTSGDYIDFGELSPSRTATGSQQLLVATNAPNGYNIFVSGTTMTSGNNVISAMANNANAVPGTGQFGLNLVANSFPLVGADVAGPGVATPTNNYDQPNLFRFVPGEAVASASTSSDYRKFTVSYVVDVPSGQAPGIYATTMTYIALGNF